MWVTADFWGGGRKSSTDAGRKMSYGLHGSIECEPALENQSKVWRPGDVVHNEEEFSQHPPIRDYIRGSCSATTTRPAKPDDRAQAAAPANHSVENSAGHHRLIKYPQHIATDVEGPELLQEE